MTDRLLYVSVSNQYERGMSGIGIPKNENENGTAYVCLYYTESSTQEDGTDFCPKSYYCEPKNNPLETVYIDTTILNDKLINLNSVGFTY